MSRFAANLMLFIAPMLSLLLLTSCQTEIASAGVSLSSNVANEPTNQALMLATLPSAAQPAVTLYENQVRFQNDSVQLLIAKPAGWETFSTEYGVVIAEKFGSLATEGELEGLMAYTFVTPLTDFTLPTSGNENNITEVIFRQIVANPEYIRNAAIAGPFGFEWDGNDAAYYLLNDGDGNVTMVLGVSLTELTLLLTSSISAPEEHSERIRAALPELLSGLQINDLTFSDTPLLSIPSSLAFPALGQ